MKLNKLVMSVIILSILIFTGCDSDSTTNAPDETLVEYLIENNLDLPDMLNGWIITASAVNSSFDDYYIIDTRSQGDYDAGHIPGAVWADASNILDVAANSNGKIIVVHCYKGIGATRLLIALRLSGHEDAKSLKFGASSWHTDFDSWSGAVGDVAASYPNGWVTTGDPTPAENYTYPQIATEEVASAAALLAERVDILLSDGYAYANAADVLADPNSYFVNNYWPQTAWDDYGHISGAYRISSLSLENGGINNMNPDVPVINYCWTSQTSGMITAYLTVLGYEAQSLIKGANGMIWTQLTSHKWDTFSGNGIPGENAPGEYTIEN